MFNYLNNKNNLSRRSGIGCFYFEMFLKQGKMFVHPSHNRDQSKVCPMDMEISIILSYSAAVRSLKK
jgi:hypothetical protein